jgi:polyhydroxyalkanoate synthesis regulator phasin
MRELLPYQKVDMLFAKIRKAGFDAIKRGKITRAELKEFIREVDKRVEKAEKEGTLDNYLKEVEEMMEQEKSIAKKEKNLRLKLNSEIRDIGELRDAINYWKD